jgi:hypothetical protein
MHGPSDKADMPACANCGNPMRLHHAQPALGGLPEFKSYRCFFCNEVLTKAVEAAGSSALKTPTLI